MKIDINVFLSKAISKVDKKFIIDRLYKTNIIIKKKIYKSNLFGLLLIFNKNLILKIVFSKLLPFR